MYTRKYLHLRAAVYILALSYVFGVSVAVLKDNLWMLLLGPITHLMMYVVIKAMAVFLESPENE